MPDEEKVQAAKVRIESIMGVPFSDGNQITRLKNGVEIFPSMLAAIKSAVTRVEFITYVYWTGDIAVEFANALASKAKQGIAVRVLLDAMGSKAMDGDLLDLMEESGVLVRWFRPIASRRFWLVNNRTHRKVLVVDGMEGFTGGVGIASQWEGDADSPDNWRETHFRIVGPAVRGLVGAFVANWNEAGPVLVESAVNSCADKPLGEASVQVVKSTTSAGWSDISTLLHLATELAEESIKISTAYFVPDASIGHRLESKAKEGVAIDILIPGKHTDQRLSQIAGEDMFEPLLKAGLRIWRFKPTMLHTKIILIDDYLACIGSPNFNQRSMGKDDELVLTVIDKNFNELLRKDFELDLAQSEQYVLGKWKKRSVTQRALEVCTRPFRDEL